MAPKITHSIGVLLSGGVDSAALLTFYLQKGYRIWPVYIRCGLRWEQQELFWVKKLLKKISCPQLEPLQILHLSLENAYQKNWSKTGKTPGPFSIDSSVFLPARNLLLVTKALLYLSSHQVYSIAIGVLRGNPFEDGKIGYFQLLGNLLKKSFGKPISIKAPFRVMNKALVIKKFSKTPFYLSFSCINPRKNLHCGKCNKCRERMRSFKLARIPDRTHYARG